MLLRSFAPHLKSKPASRANARQPTVAPRVLPAPLRQGVEALSGFSLANVRVHYHSPEPARIAAEAFAQGDDIHLAPGHESHLPHEAWHLIQQRQRRVPARTRTADGQALNEDSHLEGEATRMGGAALVAGEGRGRMVQTSLAISPVAASLLPSGPAVVQPARGLVTRMLGSMASGGGGGGRRPPTGGIGRFTGHYAQFGARTHMTKAQWEAMDEATQQRLNATPITAQANRQCHQHIGAAVKARAGPVLPRPGIFGSILDWIQGPQAAEDTDDPRDARALMQGGQPFALRATDVAAPDSIYHGHGAHSVMVDGQTADGHAVIRDGDHTQHLETRTAIERIAQERDVPVDQVTADEIAAAGGQRLLTSLVDPERVTNAQAEVRLGSLEEPDETIKRFSHRRRNSANKD